MLILCFSTLFGICNASWTACLEKKLECTVFYITLLPNLDIVKITKLCVNLSQLYLKCDYLLSLVKDFTNSLKSQQFCISCRLT